MKLIFFNAFFAISGKPIFGINFEECPEMCPRILAPVCGSNGVSYGNKCEFERAKCESNKTLFVLHSGYCDSKTSVPDCPLFCNRMMRPVCGSDNQTYSNQCLLKVASCKKPSLNLVMTHEGSCGDYDIVLKKTNTSCPSFCHRMLRPVCGSNNVTYSNECLLRLASCKEPSTNLLLRHEGACEDPTSDDKQKNELNIHEKVTLDAEIKLKKADMDCPSFCHRMLRPVCGSNNVTYYNECVLKRTACQNPTGNITLKSNGACESINLQTDKIEFTKTVRMITKTENMECPKFCNRIRNPVCGSDNKTYTNACVLKRRSCSRPSLKLIIRAPGPCLN